MEYETVIGLEVHCQLKTKTKVWCSCNADYDNEAPMFLRVLYVQDSLEHCQS